MKKILVGLSVFSLIGCVSNDYSEPNPEIEQARLRLVSIPSNNNGVDEVTPNKNCMSFENSAGIATLGWKINALRPLSRINMPAYNEDIIDAQQNEVYIPSGTEFAFSFSGIGIAGIVPGASNGGIIYSYCQKAIAFTPSKGANYEALYDYVELENGQETCGVKLFEIVDMGEGSYEKIEVNDYRVIEAHCN